MLFAGCPGKNPISGPWDLAPPGGDGGHQFPDGRPPADRGAAVDHRVDTVPSTDGAPPPAGKALYAAFYLKNWGSGLAGATQWTSLVLANPSGNAATVTVRVHKVDGSGVLASFDKTLAAGAFWSAHGDTDWLAIPDTDAAKGAGIGWLEVRGTQQVFGVNRLTLRSGSTYNAPLVQFEDVPLEAAPAKILYAPYVLQNQGTSVSGATLWASPVIVNPSGTAATLTVKIQKTDGSGPAATLSKTVPAGGWWNAYGDSDWLGVSLTNGWLEVSADQPVFGVNRITLRSGTTYSAPLVFLDDVPLLAAKAKTLRAPLYLKSWGSGMAGVTQWSNVAVVNPGGAAASVQVKVSRTDGTSAHLFTKSIPAGGRWDSFGDAQWLAVPDTSATGALGWVELSADQPLVGTTRNLLRTGNAHDDPVLTFNDHPLAPATHGALRAIFYLKNWGSGMAGGTQWSDLMLANPNAQAATLTIKVHRSDGSGLLQTLTKTVPAQGWFNTYGDADWQAIPHSDPANSRSLGWVEVTASQPVLGIERIRVVDGATYNAPLLLLEDFLLEPGS